MSELLSKTNERDIHTMKKVARTPRITKPSRTEPSICTRCTNTMKAEPQTCTRCGLTHGTNQQCPAFGVECRKCGKANHFARMCRSNHPKTKQRIQSIEENQETDEEDEPPAEIYMCNKIRNCKNRREDQTKDWHAILIVDGNPVKFKIDTGAQCNIMSSETYKKTTSNKPLQKSKTRLVAFNQTPRESSPTL